MTQQSLEQVVEAIVTLVFSKYIESVNEVVHTNVATIVEAMVEKFGADPESIIAAIKSGHADYLLGQLSGRLESAVFWVSVEDNLTL